MIKLTKQEWKPIWARITQEHVKSVWMISWKLKQELGFTVRTHRNPTDSDYLDDVPICLDFYDEQMEVYFRLKYL